jgi:hypothetical protein
MEKKKDPALHHAIDSFREKSNCKQSNPNLENGYHSEAETLT